MRHINIPIFIPQAGCPFQCIFCNQQRIVDQNWVPNVEEARDQIQAYLAAVATEAEIEVAFFGGSFTALPMSEQARYLEAAAPFLDQGLIHGIRLSTRPDCITPPVLELLRHHGVTTVELGVQSMHDSVLTLSQRGYDSSEVMEAARLVKQYGFRLGIQLMVGLPGDTPQRALASAMAAVSLQADMVRIYPTLVLVDTALACLWQQGRYQPLSLLEAIGICADMLLVFQYHNVPVIRLGLQSSEELYEPGTVLAGPLHPGFGELVEQHIFLEQAHRLLSYYDNEKLPGRTWSLMVHPRDISKMIGHRQSNLKALAGTHPTSNLTVAAYSELDRNSIGISPDREAKPCQVVTRIEHIQQLIQCGRLPKLYVE